MEVLLPRSSSGNAVDDLLAGLALREPSLGGTSADGDADVLEDAQARGGEDIDEDVDTLSDQDSHQLQVRRTGRPRACRLAAQHGKGCARARG